MRALALVVLLLVACSSRGSAPARVDARVVAPLPSVAAARPAPTDRCTGVVTPSSLHVAPGFCVRPLASGFARARTVVVGEGGELLVIESGLGRRAGRVSKLTLDQRGEYTRTVWLSGLESPHGAVLHGGYLYLATPGRIVRVRYPASETPALEQVGAGYPSRGLHTHRGLGLGPDGALYFSLGSATNNCGRVGALAQGEEPCSEAEPELAAAQGAMVRGALYRVDLATQATELFARGLRNNLGFSWHPASRRMWAVDNGRDFIQRVSTLSDEEFPHEELNEVVRGGDYGWPYCFDVARASPEYPGREEHCRTAVRAPTLLPAHAAPLSIVFYTGTQFPERLRGAFVSYHGYRPNGRRVVHVPFDASGAPSGPPEDFLVATPSAGDPQGQFSGLAVNTDGSLLVTDDTGGVLYEIRHNGRGETMGALPTLAVATEPAEVVEARCRAMASRQGSFVELERTVLDTTCVLCHAAGAGSLTLRRCALDENFAALTRGRSLVFGPYVLPGNLQAGVLLTRLRTDAMGQRMPPPGIPLPAGSIDRFEQWIREGAPAPTAP